MRLFLCVFALCASLLAGAAQAQQNLTELTESAAPGSDSILYVVINPASSPADRKVTIANLIQAALTAGINHIKFTAHDAPPTCSGGVYFIHADLSETIYKKCQNGVLTNLDTGGDVSAAGNNTFTGANIFQGNFALDDVSPAQITGDQNDYTGCAGKALCRISTDINRTVTGMTDGSDGRMKRLYALDSGFTLAHESSSSAAANRFHVDSASDLTIGIGEAAELWYDATLARWRVHWLKSPSFTGETDTPDSVFDRSVDGKITGATESKPFKVCNTAGTTCWDIYVHSALGPILERNPPGDNYLRIPTNQKGGIWDVENNCAIIDVDPDAASPLAAWTLGCSLSKWKKTAWAPAGNLFGDGTQCPAAPSTVTIGSGAPRQSFICLDNDGATLYGEFSMPDAWDGGTVTLMGEFIQTAADTNSIDSDVAAACRRPGDTINNTWGTEVPMDLANVGGSGKRDTVTTAAITPNGTCTGNERLLQFRWQFNAASTTASATLHMTGFKLEYSVSSLSD